MQTRIPIVLMVIVGLVTSGCEQAHVPPATGVIVDEVRAASKPVEHPASASGVYVLWQWKAAPLATATTAPLAPALRAAATTRPTAKALAIKPRRERAFEVVQVFVDEGQPVGFRRVRGQLIAVAGPTTRPLTNDHFCWRKLPGDDDVSQVRLDVPGVVIVVGVVVGIAALIAAPFVIDHYDRHAHLVKTIGRALDDCDE